MRVGVVDLATGELQIFDAPAPGFPPETHEAIEVPTGYPDVLGWDETLRQFRWPRWRTPDQVYALFTPTEKAGIHGSTYPPVHGLVAAMFAHRGLIDLDGTFHQQGISLLLGLGHLTEARADDIRAGAPPPVE